MHAQPQELAHAIQRGFDRLPGWKSPFFNRLWGAGKLTCADAPSGLDVIDELNARLVCATIAANDRLLIGLPDARVSRRSAILATGLIKTFVEAMERRETAGDVLYFGSRIGIRNQLEHAYLSGKRVTSFFQTQCTKGSVEQEAACFGPRPRLLCVYSPVDPVSIVSEVKPKWVAIDCDDSTDLQWLGNLLSALERRHISTVAWSSNPLSRVHRDFGDTRGKRFIWPLIVLGDEAPVNGESVLPVESILSAQAPTTDLVPCEITGHDAEEFAQLVHTAEVDLAKGISAAKGRLGHDAFLVAYRLLRLLERMPVPLSIYEENCGKYWGLRSVAALSSAVAKFVDALDAHSGSLAAYLRAAQTTVDAVRLRLAEGTPPLWNALVDLCIEDNPCNAERLLVFNTESHARMFIDALTAQEGTSLEMLRDMHVFPMSLTAVLRRCASNEGDALPPEARHIASRSKRPWWATVVGIPSEYTYRRLAPLLASDAVEFLHYPHQRSRLALLIDFLNDALSPSPDAWSSTLSGLAGRSGNGHVQPRRVDRFRLAAARCIQGRSRTNVRFVPLEPLWQGGSTVDALRLLFSGDDGIDESRTVLPLHDESEAASDNADAIPITVDTAVELRFSGGWSGLFAADQRLNIVGAEEALTQKRTKAVSVGDRVLYILGHQQQSLYDLVVSRVHNDPEIRLHLDYIGNWQREARARFADWLRSGKTLEDLYRAMVQRGTTIQSGLAIYNWCEGLTLRPRDKEDLRRLADLLEMPFTRKCYLQIHRAGDRIHGLHIQLSLRLRRWIQQGAVATEMRDEIIDEASGLTFGDIQDALLVLTVTKVNEVTGPFYGQNLGTIERATNA